MILKQFFVTEKIEIMDLIKHGIALVVILLLDVVLIISIVM